MLTPSLVLEFFIGFFAITGGKVAAAAINRWIVRRRHDTEQQ